MYRISCAGAIHFMVFEECWWVLICVDESIYEDYMTMKYYEYHEQFTIKSFAMIMPWSPLNLTGLEQEDLDSPDVGDRSPLLQPAGQTYAAGDVQPVFGASGHRDLGWGQRRTIDLPHKSWQVIGNPYLHRFAFICCMSLEGFRMSWMVWSLANGRLERQ